MWTSPACNRVRMAKLARSPPGRSRSKRAIRASGNWTLTASSTASVPNPEGSSRAPRQDGQFSGTCPVLPQWPHRSRPSCLWYTHPTAQAGHFTAWPQSQHWRTGEYPLRLRNRRAFLPAARQAAIASVSGGLSMVPQGASRLEEHTSELQSLAYLVCRLLLEKKKNHPSWKYTVETKRIANQNVGTATPTMEMVRASQSIHESRRIAARIPNPMPMMNATIAERVANSIVAGNDSASSVSTGRWVEIDVPRFPRTRLAR